MAKRRRPRAEGQTLAPATYLRDLGITPHPSLSLYVVKDADGRAIGAYDSLKQAKSRLKRGSTVWYVTATKRRVEGADQIIVRPETVRGPSSVVRGMRSEQLVHYTAVDLVENRVF